MIKKILLYCIFLVLPFFQSTTFADSSWTIIPQGSGNKAKTYANQVGKPGKVWTNYNKIAEKLKKNDVGTAFASGIFSWNTIFYFLQHIAKILSEIGLVIGAGMIIYAGYKYASGVFTGDASKGGKDAIKGAIYGILIVIFSYAIMKILLAMFL